MQRSNQTSAAVFVSERPTEVFIVAVDPDDPNDPVFVDFVDEDDPSEVPDFLARETNRLADSKDLADSEGLAVELGEGPLAPADSVAPSGAAYSLTSGTNRLTDSEDLAVKLEGPLEPATGFMGSLRLAQYEPGPDHWHTAGALLGMMGYLVTVGVLLCS